MLSSFGLRRSYMLLFGLVVLFSLLSGFAIANNEQWWSGYLSDIAAGILSSLMMIFFIDRLIERNKEKERVKVVGIALKRLISPIKKHMDLLCNMYKAAVQSKPKSLPTSFKDIFTHDYYKEISYLDFTKEAPVALKMDWFAYLGSETRIFQKNLQRVIDTYTTYLDVALIDMLERIAGSAFIQFAIQIEMYPAISKRYGYKPAYRISGIEVVLKEHVSDMLKLIEYINSHADSPIQFDQGVWGDNIAPRWGSDRVSAQSL